MLLYGKVGYQKEGKRMDYGKNQSPKSDTSGSDGFYAGLESLVRSPVCPRVADMG